MSRSGDDPYSTIAPADPAIPNEFSTVIVSPPSASSSGSSSPGLPETTSHQIGDYSVISELGRGTMGVVYKARDKLNRLVALKMILVGEYASGDAIARFKNEAQAIADLKDLNIVQIYAIGEDKGQPFFALEFCEGGSLKQYLTGRPLPNRTAAEIAKVLARAMHLAHTKGIIHRDLKPANILIARDQVSSSGESAATQQTTNSVLDLNSAILKIADFGLAKRLSDDKALTMTGTIMGTLAYMAPEQAEGQIHDISPLADVYSIGAILYEMLTGRVPIAAGVNIKTTLERIREAEPIPPQQLNPSVDRDLETICLKCLEKAPHKRFYASAESLANDLQRNLDGGEISARPIDMVERLTRTLTRDHLESAFRDWSAIAFYLAGVLAIPSCAVSVFFLTGLPRIYTWFAHATVLVLTIVGIWWIRFRRPTPISASERQIVALVAGNYLAIGSLYGVLTILQTSQFDERTLYPHWSIYSGFSWFFIGRSHWGRCYVYGVAFFALALVTPLNLNWAPAEFGLLWALSLLDVGMRFRQLGDSKATR